jgi:hypothetical protein
VAVEEIDNIVVPLRSCQSFANQKACAEVSLIGDELERIIEGMFRIWVSTCI